MMYQTIIKNYLNKKNQFLSQKSQAGVSLLMAILVLASITAISFSLATIVFVEIRSSSDFVRSERALYAAYAVTEEALFKYSRNASFSYLNGASGLNNVSLVLTETSTNTSPYTDIIASGSSKQYNLVDTTDPNGPGNYGGIRVVDVSTNGDTLTVDFYEIDPSPPVGESGRTLLISTTLSAYNQSWEDLLLDPNMQYELNLTNSSGTNGISVNIYTYDDVGASKGLPNIGEQYVDIIASYLGLTRKYQARIPSQ